MQVAMLVSALLLLVGLGSFWLGNRNLSFGNNPSVSYHRLTFQRGTIDAARFAPDGMSIFYSARWRGGPAQIFTTRAEHPESSTVPLPGAELLSVSSLGEIAISLNPKHFYWVNTGTLARAPLVGNTYRELFENVTWAD